MQDWKRIRFCLIPGFITSIHLKGMDVIAMIKKSSRIKYSYCGKQLNIKEIYSRNKKRRDRLKFSSKSANLCWTWLVNVIAYLMMQWQFTWPLCLPDICYMQWNNATMKTRERLENCFFWLMKWQTLHSADHLASWWKPYWQVFRSS